MNDFIIVKWYVICDWRLLWSELFNSLQYITISALFVCLMDRQRLWDEKGHYNEGF